MSETQQQDIKQQVANLIRETRRARGLTQKDIAKELGVSEGTYNRYENDLSNLSVETVAKVAKSMGLRAKVVFE